MTMWQQPKTLKLYLHPPLANRQVTLWPDAKIVSKAVVPPPGQEPDDFGLRLLVGQPLREPNWQSSCWQVRDDGYPMPMLAFQMDELAFTIEAFCDTALQPLTYLKLAIHNSSPAAAAARLGLMTRSGLDRLLIGMGGDYYASYRPQLGHWDMISNTWQLAGSALVDGQHQIRFSLPADAQVCWQAAEAGNREAKNVALLKVPIAGCSAAVIYFTLGSQVPEPSAQAWDAARTAAEAFWRQQYADIQHWPDIPAALDPMFRHLVSQCLQMLVTTANGEIWPRQGGRYDGIWPVEAMEWLRALDHLGLHAWTRLGYAFFLAHQVHGGEDDGRFVGANSPLWQNQTGGVLYGLGAHLESQPDPQLFATWRQPILDAVQYIERLRQQTRDDPALPGYGLMPAGIGHDWEWKGQYWCFSDSVMYMGVRAAAQAFTARKDDQAPRLTAIADDYLACMQNTLRLVTAGQDDREDVYIPNVLGIAESYPPFGPYGGDGPSNLIRASVIDPHSPLFERLERFWRRLGWMQRGLNQPMTECLMTQGYFADPWAGYTWYASFADYHWFKGWMARGERGKAAETLQAQLRYGMSAEYYMLERYAANDPTFCPWQPNASANGRTIEMLFDFYGEK